MKININELSAGRTIRKDKKSYRITNVNILKDAMTGKPVEVELTTMVRLDVNTNGNITF